MTAPAGPFAGLTLLDAAVRWHAAGCSVLPIRLDGSKRPVGTWADLQQRAMPEQQVRSAWSGAEQYGIAVACGAGSGNLEMIEFEGRAVADGTLGDFLDACKQVGLGELAQRVAQGYVEQSPKGGLHLFYRVSGAAVPGNTRLAQQPITRPDGTVGREPLIETRGQGGYVIVAPTPAEASDLPAGHKRPWVAGGNGPEQIATVTADEREQLVRLCRTFDRMPVGAGPSGESSPGVPLSSSGTAGPAPGIVAGAPARPGDLFAARTGWPAILGPHGWRVAFTRGDKTYWTRPGKQHGISATTSDDGAGGLWVFTTSTTFEPELLYTKLGAHAHLNHGGDISAAASALAAQYGTGDTWAGPPLSPLAGPRAGPGPQSATGGTPWAPGPGQATNPPGGATTDHVTGSAAIGQPTSAPPDTRANVHSTWAPVDLSLILAGEYEPPAADLMPRTDGVRLLYRGRTHSLIGESESGKSLVAQAECARILRETPDELVAYIDYEDDPAPVVQRLVAMGAPRDAIAARFHYIKPQASPYSMEESEQFRMLLGRRYALVVLDGVTGAILQMGDRPGGNPNEVITKWARRVLDPIAQWTGAAVLTIDHFNKNADERGRYATGGHAKMDVCTGAVYTCEPLHTLGVGLCGTVVVRIAKDRPSGVRPHCGPRRPGDRTQEAARIVIDSTQPGKTIVSVAPHETGDVRSGPERPPRPTVLMERISAYLAAVGAASKNQIESGVRGKTPAKRDALTELVAGGYVLAEQTSARGGGFRYSLLRPYSASEEPQVTAGAANFAPIAEQATLTDVSAQGGEVSVSAGHEGGEVRGEVTNDHGGYPQVIHKSAPTSPLTSPPALSSENANLAPTSPPTSPLAPAQPPEPRPLPPPPTGGAGEREGGEDSVGPADGQATQDDQRPTANGRPAGRPAPDAPDSALPEFRAPAAPGAAPEPMAQPPLRPGQRPCERCRWPLAAQLVELGLTEHPLDCTAVSSTTSGGLT
jgi:hypothetical protein